MPISILIKPNDNERLAAEFEKEILRLTQDSIAQGINDGTFSGCSPQRRWEIILGCAQENAKSAFSTYISQLEQDEYDWIFAKEQREFKRLSDLMNKALNDSVSKLKSKMEELDKAVGRG